MPLPEPKIEVAVNDLDEEKMAILQMLADKTTINAAAVDGIDTIYGYADSEDREQGERIELARKNIIVAIRAAMIGTELVAVSAI